VSQDAEFAESHLRNVEKLDETDAEELLAYTDDTKYTSTLAQQLTRIWKSPAIQKTFAMRKHFWLPENTEYYQENSLRFADSRDFMFSPSPKDILRVRIKTTGIQEFEMPDDDLNKTVSTLGWDKSKIPSDFPFAPRWKIIDFGGQRSERRKWLPHMSIAAGVLFFVNLHCYKCVLYEDTKMLRVNEDIELIKKTLSTNFKGIPVAVVFTKQDLFEHDFDIKDFRKAFQDYEGPDDSTKALEHLIGAFSAVIPKDRKYPVNYSVITTFEKKQVGFVMQNIQERILRANRARLGEIVGIEDKGDTGTKKSEGMVATYMFGGPSLAALKKAEA